MKLSDIKLSTKQRIAFGFIMLFLTAISFYSLRTIEKIKTEMDEVTGNWLPRALAIADLNLSTANLRMNQLQYVFAADTTEKDIHNGIIIDLIDQIHQNLDIYDSLKTESVALNLYSEQEQSLYDLFEDKWDDYLGSSLQSLQHSRNNNIREANAILLHESIQKTYADFSEKLVELVQVNRKESSAAALRAGNASQAAHQVTIIFLASTLVLFTLSAVLLGRFVIKPIKLLEKAANTVSSGDLSVRLLISGKDEIGNLASSFNHMTASLQKEKKKTERQATKLREQHEQLQVAFGELEYKNADLQRALRQLKTAQEQLLLKEKMASLGDLVAGLAHEINNPIGTITASTDVSQRCVLKIEDVLDKNASLRQHNGMLQKSLTILKSNIRITLEAGDRIVTLIKSLKNFSRLDEAGYKVADIHEGLESTLTLLSNEWKGRISIEKNYGDIPPIPCYPGQLNQVFLNVLKNAIDAIDGPGTITIQSVATDKNTQIEIADTGHGISPEKQKNLFDFSFSETSARVKLGSGLTTAYNIIRQHKGEIKVESELGTGTTVRISLPVKKYQISL
ncbi:MAG: ATP-binding protein [bacterium]